MPTRMISMDKTRAILSASQVESTHRAIARLSNTSRTAVQNTLARIAAAQLNIDTALTLSDPELRAIIYPLKQDAAESERATDLQSRMPTLMKELGKKHMTLQFLWEKYRAEKHDGYAYSQFCEHVSRFKKSDDYYFPMEYEYGKQMFIDFAGDGHFYIDRNTNEKIAANLFVAILPASLYTIARFTAKQRSEDWIDGTEYSMRFLGGVPASVVPDCAKAVVKKTSRLVAEVADRFKLFTSHYGTVVAPARSASPRDKALVENAVNNIYRYVYPRLSEKTYGSLEELNTALAQLIQQMNARTMKKYAASRQQIFDEYERSTLKTLPEKPYPHMEYQAPRSAQFNSHVWLTEDKHYYSVPHHYCGKKCSVLFDAKTVEIYSENRLIATHPRNNIPHRKYTTDKNHMPQSTKAFMEWTPQRFESWAKRIGEHVLITVHGMFERSHHATQMYKSCMALLSLTKIYGDARLERACAIALSSGSANYHRVKTILENNADQTYCEQPSQEEHPIEHENIRYTTSKEMTA